jgi:hypothetical protein
VTVGEACARFASRRPAGVGRPRPDDAGVHPARRRPAGAG